ncbi:MAG: hypothetical protein WBD20_17610, partial [Pirellulaceae bacterium]
MREICTSGSVRDGDGNVPIYSAQGMDAIGQLPGVTGVGGVAIGLNRSGERLTEQLFDHRRAALGGVT